MPDTQIQAPVTLPTLGQLIDNDGAGLPNPPTPPIVPPITPPVVDPPAPDPMDPPAPTPDPNAPAVVPDPNTPEGGDGDDDLTVEEFFGQVDALRGGDPVFSAIDYGTVDPMSPEGMLMRDQYIEERAVQGFQSYIQQTDPRAYAYMLHRQNGGSDESFFEVKSFVLPELDKVKESVDLQRTVLTEALKAKGNSDKQIAVLLKAAADAGELAGDAEAAYNEIKKRDENIANSTLEQSNKRIARQKADIAALDSTVNSVITEGKELRFQIPDSEKGKFAQAFKANVHYEDGQFYYIKPLTREAIPKILETELFAYLGGDLGKMIQKAATTVSAQRFIKKVQAADADKNKNTQNTPTGGMTLGQL